MAFRRKTFVVAARAERGDPLVTKIYQLGLLHRLLEVLVVKGYPQGAFDLIVTGQRNAALHEEQRQDHKPNPYAFWLGFKPSGPARTAPFLLTPDYVGYHSNRYADCSLVVRGRPRRHRRSYRARRYCRQ